MIKGMHGLLYTPKAEEARDFLKDKLGFASVDAGDGWLIFDVPKAEVAVHPANDTHHEISFWCDDIEATVKELKGRGVTFQTPIEEQPWGRITTMEVPGGATVLLYEPKHPQPGG
jgi:uncharacterized glyoxalase superfamily protein PhnB